MGKASLALAAIAAATVPLAESKVSITMTNSCSDECPDSSKGFEFVFTEKVVKAGDVLPSCMDLMGNCGNPLLKDKFAELDKFELSLKNAYGADTSIKCIPPSPKDIQLAGDDDDQVTFTAEFLDEDQGCKFCDESKFPLVASELRPSQLTVEKPVDIDNWINNVVTPVGTKDTKAAKMPGWLSGAQVDSFFNDYGAVPSVMVDVYACQEFGMNILVPFMIDDNNCEMPFTFIPLEFCKADGADQCLPSVFMTDGPDEDEDDGSYGPNMVLNCDSETAATFGDPKAYEKLLREIVTQGEPCEGIECEPAPCEPDCPNFDEGNPDYL